MKRERPAQRSGRSSFRYSLPQGRRLVMGRNSIREILDHSADHLERVFVGEGEGSSTDSSRKELLSELKSKQIPIEYIHPDDITALVNSDSHQSFVGVVKAREELDLKSLIRKFEDKEEALVVILDSIYDPQNLGALLRVAEAVSADAVIWSRNRGTDITPVVSKASVGASELVEILRVSNLHDSVLRLKDAGFWIVSSVLDDTAESLLGFEFPKRTVLILGSEGEGIQPLLIKNSDFKVFIPLFGRVESLNVSQAATVLLYAYRGVFTPKVKSK